MSASCPRGVQRNYGGTLRLRQEGPESESRHCRPIFDIGPTRRQRPATTGSAVLAPSRHSLDTGYVLHHPIEPAIFRALWEACGDDAGHLTTAHDIAPLAAHARGAQAADYSVVNHSALGRRNRQTVSAISEDSSNALVGSSCSISPFTARLLRNGVARQPSPGPCPRGSTYGGRA